MTIAANELGDIPTAASVLAILRRHESELRSAGVLSAALFGSVARGEAGPQSDVDLVVRLDDHADLIGLAKIGQMIDAQELLARLVGRPVDIVMEPIRKPALRQEIERDRIVAFS